MDRAEQLLVRILPLFFETLCFCENIIVKALDACLDADLGPVSIVSHGPENVQHRRGSARGERFSRRFKSQATFLGPTDYPVLFAIFESDSVYPESPQVFRWSR